MCLDLKLMIIGQKFIEEKKATFADEITQVDEIHKEQLFFKSPAFPLRVTPNFLSCGMDGGPSFVLWCVFRKSLVWTWVRFQRHVLNKALITSVSSVISLGNSWWDQKKKKKTTHTHTHTHTHLCSFIACLYGLLFDFYYQFKISFLFFFWPFHKPVKIALLHKKEKETESKARCAKIEHTL